MRRKYSHAELLAAVAAGELTGAVHVTVLHNGTCTPHVCVCSPEYVAEDLTVEAYEAGQKAQAKWVKESTS